MEYMYHVNEDGKKNFYAANNHKLSDIHKSIHISIWMLQKLDLPDPLKLFPNTHFKQCAIIAYMH